MFTTDQPIARNHALSARVENRGPLMTTIVPPSWTVRPDVAGRPRTRAAR